MYAILIYILNFSLQLCEVFNSTILERNISFYSSMHVLLYYLYSLLFYILNFLATAVCILFYNSIIHTILIHTCTPVLYLCFFNFL